MKFKLENPQHQITAIRSVVEVFRGMEKNTYDNAHNEDIHSNVCSLTFQALENNIKKVIQENNIPDFQAYITSDNDACIEMETGTGKTLTYIETAYELNKEYGLTKFIVLVPSIPIRQGVIDTFTNFKEQLADKYDLMPNTFVYDSSKLSLLRDFIVDDSLQIMVMTIASFNSEDKILNQVEREGLFNNLPYLDAIAQTHPIIFMDEPQEGMDTENSQRWLEKLNPLFKFRYSATHAVKKNVLYQLTPAESYRLGLVKKLEVLTVAESNDEATLKMELSSVQATNAAQPKVKLKLWKLKKTDGKFEFKDSAFLKKDDNLADKTGNESYRDFTINRIYKTMSDKKWHVDFTNGTSISEGSTSANKEEVWGLQLEWLIRRHFENRVKLRPQGIKNLSLIFIDRVANYISPERPIIKLLFEEKYKLVYAEFNNGQLPTAEEVTAVQGFYFAKTTNGEFTDNEKACSSNKEIYDEILHNKQKLLSFNSSTIEFIFSHSALGVGWDNPNVFGIATLNESYSENKKRQEIGRGLRICVNQNGERVYDKEDTPDDEILNQLTVVPNETYETFARTYQKENEDAYGKPGPKPKHTHKGKHKNRITFKIKKEEPFMNIFRRFWKTIARKTSYRVHMDEDVLIQKSIEALNGINISQYIAEVSSYKVCDIANVTESNYEGSETYELHGHFTPQDLVEDLSEKTGLCYTSIMRILSRIDTKKEYLKNPPVFMEQAAFKIRQVQLDELVRCAKYEPNGAEYPFNFEDFTKDGCDNYVETPNHGLWDKMLYDSGYEKSFAEEADKPMNSEVLCFLKFPSWYKIDTPIGSYEPDFGVVLHKKQLLGNQEDKEYYFVVEIKGTEDATDIRALTPHEVARIKFAISHFRSLGIEAYYKAPIKEYSTFKAQANETIKNENDGNV